MAPTLLSACQRRLAAAFAALTWSEVSGSLGDLGTFLPLLIGLVQKVHLDLGTTLIVSGAYNIVSGLQFGIPMCVQPMKTIAAVALAAGGGAGLNLSQLLHAGLFVAACVGLLGLSRAVELFAWLVPPPVVRGVQLAVGANLAIKGVDMALRLHPAGSSVPHWRPLLGSEGLLLGAAALAALVVTTIADRVAGPWTADAGEDGGLRPRPTDTVFEPLLRRLWPSSHPQHQHQQQAAQGSPSPFQSAAPESQHARPLASSAAQPSASSSTAAFALVVSSTSAFASPAPSTAAFMSASPSAATLASAASASFDVVMDGGKGEEAALLGSRSQTRLSAPGGPGDVEGPSGSRGVGLAAAEASLLAAGCGGCGDGSAGGARGGAAGGTRRLPSALIAVVTGLVVAIAARPSILRELKFGPSAPHLLRPNAPDFAAGALRAGLPQLPLTVLNSVIAVTHLADVLFPDRRDSARWRPWAVAVSVAALNGVGCWLGAMPCCHGAGGLAAQFGGRTGVAPVFLGCVKAGLGLLFGSSLLVLLQAFPQPLLGALLVVSGVELASTVRHTRTPRGYTYALLTAVCILATDTGTGFLLGLGAVLAVNGWEAGAQAWGRWWPVAAERLARWRGRGRGGAAGGPEAGLGAGSGYEKL
ncbi:hypothetical protein HYH03_001999 [Edaphochlamys debaryana]|uniref:Sulfate transporter n=1 Tax=Edaphochlamys debaryana TaxID=47281 RepID=A0A835YCL2_9CHLO|nr:hypothetical protein HYH03_001999 [Edaphochlamys debaryana]|eukprot:KAG2500430.1 hypothetical protein HYH03_001999 [Edaphochlamys debaryana]